MSRSVRTGFLRFALVGWLGLWFWTGGCASRQDVDILQRQIWTTRRELKDIASQVDKLEKDMSARFEKLSERVDTGSQPIRRNQAALGVQLDRIELELGQLTGQLEETAAMTARHGEEISEVEKRQMASMADMQEKIDNLGRGLNRVADYLGLQELAVRHSAQGKQPEKAAESGASAGPAEEERQEKPGPSREELYREAFGLFRAGEFQKARAGFTLYLQRYPGTDLADNAQFWLGECYYAEKDYQRAIASYEKTIKDYPESDKVSSALLKQGMAFLELGDKTAARILLKKIVKEHPNTNQAQIAQNKLSRIQ